MNWLKSSKSGGNDGGDCVWVKVERTGDHLTEPKEFNVFVKDEHGNVCQFNVEEWRAFIEGAKFREFDYSKLVDGWHRDAGIDGWKAYTSEE